MISDFAKVAWTFQTCVVNHKRRREFPKRDQRVKVLNIIAFNNHKSTRDYTSV